MKKITIFILSLTILSAPLYAQSKKTIILGVIGQAAMAADERTTRDVILSHVVAREPGGIIIVQPARGYEADPLARPFVHLPAPLYYTSGAVVSGSASYLGWKMKNSKHKALRRIWWLPQTLQIATNSYFAWHNTTIR